MKGLETAIIQALREAGSADAQNRARIYQSARDALARAVAKQQLEGTESAVNQKRKLEKLINTIEAEYQRALERRREAAHRNPASGDVPEPRVDREPGSVGEIETGRTDPGEEFPSPAPEAAGRSRRPGRTHRIEPAFQDTDEAAAERAEDRYRPDDPEADYPDEAGPAPGRRPAARPARPKARESRVQNSKPAEDDWPFDDTEGDWPFDDTAGDWPFDDADDLVDDEPGDGRRHSPPRGPERPAASRGDERRRPAAAPAAHGRQESARKAGGPVHGSQKRQQEPELRRKRQRRPQQAASREEPGFADQPRRPSSGQERSRRQVRWTEPDDGGYTSRRPVPEPRRKKRFPIYSLILVVTLCIAFAGIGIWWFVIGGLGLSAEERDTSVPNPPATVETENFEGSPRPQGRFGDAWITVFTPEDITQVTENSGVAVDLIDNGGRQALRVQSRSPDEDGEASFEIGAGVLQSMAGRESLIALTLRSSSETPTQIYVRCHLPGLGDCGRRRFDVSYEIRDVFFNVDLGGKSFSGEGGELFINSDVSGDEGSIDLFAIRIRPE